MLKNLGGTKASLDPRAGNIEPLVHAFSGHTATVPLPYGTSTPSKAMGTIVMLFMKSLILYSETRLLGRGIIFY